VLLFQATKENPATETIMIVILAGNHPHRSSSPKKHAI
jgi:hypothetical protein